MRKLLLLLCTIMLVFLVVGCSEDRITSPTNENPDVAYYPGGLNPEILAVELIETAGWELDPEAELPELAQVLDPTKGRHFPSFTREEIAHKIAHYTFEIRIGDGPYDIIRVHRVVKERRPFKPVRTNGNLFLLPGDGAGFEAAFLLSTLSDAMPDEHCISTYLASHKVDVWGIDLAWTQVPAEAEDQSFMADWGLQKDIDDLRLAGGVARFVRLMTGQGGGNGHHGGDGRMNLLGWSRGGMIGYACLSEESQLPRRQRQFSGFIPTDIWAKTQTYNDEECGYAADLQGMMEEGIYADDTGAFLGWMLEMAMTAPDDISEVFGEPYTNLMAVLAVGSQTYMLSPIPEHYSIMAGTFDSEGLPTGINYAADQVWFDFIANWAPYEPVRMEMETEWAVCGDPAHPVPFFDHLGDITVPVMYVGAHGGFGEEGLYSLELLGSSDVTSLVVSLESDPFLDFAHADLFLADNAPELVWRHILDWVRDH